MSKIQWGMRWLRGGTGADAVQSDDTENLSAHRTKGCAINAN